ncbi:GGDEF domain-containing protein [Methylobacterium oryzihabitans]|uniref:GGDEF domain-containing protein n=1 Tax=Methylobacterium oryzihabitans TaxID=2499852 RepID=UPI001FEA4C9F|nr:GGDEF domain-containing protein [Methylobacterium oryzihabitans]
MLLFGLEGLAPLWAGRGAAASPEVAALCRAVAGDRVRIVADLGAAPGPKRRDHPAVAGPPGCRFLATQPLGDGSGVLALVDDRPRRLSDAERRRFAGFADALACLAGALRTVTALRAALDEQGRALAHSRKIFDRASAAARIGVWECSLPDESLTWTDQVYAMFDLPRDAPLDRNRIVGCYTPLSRAALTAMRNQAIAERGGFSLDAEIVTPLGRRRWIRINAVVEAEDEAPVRIFGMKQDITEEKLLADRTRYLAEFDTLTGLSNRATFQARCADFDQSPPGRRPFAALLLVDLDGFKPVNDTLGHAAGDACLVEIATRLRTVCRDGDAVARIGGDEFAILLRTAPPGHAEETAGRLVAALQRPIAWGGRVFAVGASIGVAHAGRRSSAELFSAADAALYAAKGEGRGRFRVAAGDEPRGAEPLDAA